MSTYINFKRALLLGLFSCAVLAAEISITRIFSVVFWYHFGFLILSTSMLGFGLGGLLVRIFRKRLEKEDPDLLVGIGTAASGPLLALSMLVITHNHFSPLFVHQSLGDLFKLAIATLSLVPPFALMGATVLFMIQHWREQVGPLYAANLLGSGLGCLAALLLMDQVGGLMAFVLFAGLMPLIGAWYCFSRKRGAAWWMLAAALFILLTLPRMDKIYPLERPSGKVAAWARNLKVHFSDWTSLSKVDIGEEDELHAKGFGMWGLSYLNQAKLPKRMGVVIDYWAYTTIIKHSEEPGYYNFYDALPMYMAYKLVKDPSALIIGAGGGMDIRGALRAGASEIDAVEINPAIVRAMRGPIAEYSGNIYQHPKVRSHLAEGRRFVESSERKYDIVQLSGVDTYSATQAGAFALSENFLYTREAIQSYLNLLTGDGVLTLTRWYAPSNEGYPRFSMRLFTLAVESLADQGVDQPWRNILFFRSGAFTVILIKNQPFRADEISLVEEEMQKFGYLFLYRPDMEVMGSFHYYDFIGADDREQWLEDYPFNVTPPTDDSPFFFEHRKMSNIYKFQAFLYGLANGLDGQTILAITLLEMILVSCLLLFISFRMDRGRSNPLGWLYFAAIGMGFMLVEVTFSQRLVLFLGHPAYALSVVMFSILVFSGLGSMASRRLSRIIPTSGLLLLTALMLLGWAIFGTAMLKLMIAWPTWLRMLISVAVLAPPSFLMGTAFPEAVRRLESSGKDLGLYWAWNGVASVTASVLAVIIAMGSGFRVVMLLAMCCYLIASLLLSRLGDSKSG